jgi:polyhydroxyalkanoate synthesis regulator phasin
VRAALEEVRTELIQQAVDEGRIAQEQGDQFLLWGGYSLPGQNHQQAPRRPNFPAQGLGQRAREAMQEALAGALDITVEELEAAQQEARIVVIEQAVEEGIISQEQADQILSHPGAGLPGHGRARGPRGFGQPGGFRPFQNNNGF